MANELRIEKLEALPAANLRTASTLYLINNVSTGDYVEAYLTSSDGSETKKFLKESDVTNMISSTLGSFSSVKVAADIAERNSFISGAPANGHNALVPFQTLVLNATGDATVASGGATYIWEPGTSQWIKISEYESLDLVLNWSSLIGAPTSTVANIDDAVTKRHTHENKIALDKIGEAGGLMTYDGKPIRAYLDAEDW